MNRCSLYSATRLAGLSIIVLTLLLTAGCVSAPKRPALKGGDGIYFVENESVDLSVRQDFNAAVKLLQDEKYKEAVELLKKVIMASQRNTAPYVNIALAYIKLGEMESAEEHLKQALVINPQHPAALNEYALLLRQTGRYAEARQQYEKVLKVYPVFMPARKNLGILCELYLNDKACAVEQYEVYSSANPDDGDVKLWLTLLRQ